ncbi:TetR/AcrR family transcriptional regulator [Herbiconiux solani]|uniref:TetR/AcrR family transcriptional regulator n=1 Tax=Herbiconiux solani TaxID=661329 RepID=UPI000824D5B9|nr:TetR/AcrR family transcriptional regulator [Herbiconiux solani]
MASRAYTSERRAIGAARTRSDILQSALALFAENGYAAVTMPQIAERARVSMATVYSAVGSKPQLVVALYDEAVEDSVADAAMRVVAEATTPAEVVLAIAHGTRSLSERHPWLLGALYDNAGAEPVIADRLAAALRDLRERMEQAALRIEALGGADDQDVPEMTTILLFYFGVAPWRSLRDAGWSWDRAEQWLALQAMRALGLGLPDAQRGRVTR